MYYRDKVRKACDFFALITTSADAGSQIVISQLRKQDLISNSEIFFFFSRISIPILPNFDESDFHFCLHLYDPFCFEVMSGLPKKKYQHQILPKFTSKPIKYG